MGAKPLTAEDYDALIEVPEPYVIYRKDTEGVTIHEWFPLWTGHDFPRLYRVWRERGGGWTRWICFEDPDGVNHALRVTTYWETKQNGNINTLEENLYLRAVAVKLRPDDAAS